MTVDWLEAFDVSSYKPMQGLLASEDFRFLSRQPGFDPSLFRKLRRDRLRIFRQYLNRLIVDFNRLHTMARLVVSQSKDDQSPLFAKLLALRFYFWLAIMRVEFSYCICRLSMRPVVVSDVISGLEAMSLQLASLHQTESYLAQ